MGIACTIAPSPPGSRCQRHVIVSLNSMPREKKQATLFDLATRPDRGCVLDASKATVKLQPGLAAIACPVCQSTMDSFTMEDRIRHVEECLSMTAIHGSPTESNELRVADLRTLKPDPVNQSEPHTPKEEHENGSLDTECPQNSEEKQEITINLRMKRKSSVKVQNQKKKRELGLPQKEMLRYVNSQPSAKKITETTLKSEISTPKGTEDQAPVELLPSTRKTEIPDLKIMKFRVSQSCIYRLSVDAFCYKPHEFIRQYFLSHFHSDHYGGITKKWCRERTINSKIIYCSVITGRLLGIRYSVEPRHLFSMVNGIRYKIHSFISKLEDGGEQSEEKSPGVYVTCIDANHCPGAVIFLFEGISMDHKSTFTLHCGDFRVNEKIMHHPLLKDFLIGEGNQLEHVYLDTTYMTPKYNFPKQEQVCDAVAELIHELSHNDVLVKQVFGTSLQSRITDFLLLRGKLKAKKYLILVGTYLIGKEKLAISILKRLRNAPIYVSNVNSRGDKEHIVRSYHDEYLDSVLTNDPVQATDHVAMIHLVPMKIAGNILELHKYFNHNGYHSHFERCIGLRPTGWSFKSTEDEDTDIIAQGDKHNVNTIEIDEAEMSFVSTALLLRKLPTYTHSDAVKQSANKRNGKVDSTTYRIYSIPYSEHLSFRELSYFVIFFNIRHVIPTVNTSNPHSALTMSEIIRRWEAIRKILKGDDSDVPQHICDEVRRLTLADF